MTLIKQIQEDVIEAAKKAAIHDFIMSLPEGYDTKMTELGGNLSSGEKQRLGLARAFLHKAPLLLLDEPTGNLDSLNEALILNSIYQEKKNKGVLCFSVETYRIKVSLFFYLFL